jgi:hypothetical protein
LLRRFGTTPNSPLRLFHDESGKAYVARGSEAIPIRSERARKLLRQIAYKDMGWLIKKGPLDEALEALEAIALFEGGCEEPAIRVAKGTDGRVEVDLNNAAGTCISIRPEGWEVRRPTRKFLRPNTMQSLPLPARDGDLDRMWEFINIKDRRDRILFLGWLVGALNPDGPYALLALYGPKGSGKSSSMDYACKLVDPAKGIRKPVSESERDLVIAGNQSWVMSFDNLSFLKLTMSDAMCRVSTGGAFAKRRNYTDDEQVLLEIKRPATVNGIAAFIQRNDLLSRTLVVNAPEITSKERKTEAEIEAAFEQAHPGILGKLCDGVSAALANKDRVQLDELPRMADFAVWVTAAESGLGLEPGSFIEAFNKAEEDQKRALLLDKPVVNALIRMMAKSDAEVWSGTPTELFEALRPHRIWEDRWPMGVAPMSKEMHLIADDLPAIGLQATWFKSGKDGRGWRIRKLPRFAVTAVIPSPDQN